MAIKTTYILLCFVMLFAIALRTYTFLNTEHLDSESVFRVMGSYIFADNPTKTLSVCATSACQRGYFFLNALLMHFVDNPIIARLTSLIFGILTIVPYYLLVGLVFPKDIALASVSALAFYSTHIIISTASMGNAGAMFFAVLAAYFFIKYLIKNNSKKESKSYFILAAVSTLLATSFRLEACVLIFLFPFILFLERKPGAAILFFIISSLYIAGTLLLACNIIVVLNNFSDSGRFNRSLSFLSNNNGMSNFGRFRISIWLNILFNTVSLPLSILGFFGMFFISREKKQYIFVLGFLSFFLLLTIKNFISESNVFTRYSYIYVMFFLPFIFVGIKKAAGFIRNLCYFNKLSHRVTVISSIIIANLYFSIFSVNILFKEIPKMKYGASLNILLDWFGKNINPGDLVFTSFSSIDIYTSSLRNKLITIDVHSAKDYNLETATLIRLAEFSEQCRAEMPGEPFHVFLLIKRGEPQIARRIVFLLDERDYRYLIDDFPDILKTIEIKYNGFMYTGSLPLRRR